MTARNHHPSTKPLNKEQLRILYALYRFRFGTTDLLRTTQARKISRQYMNTRLRILCEQEFIGRRYDTSYKLQARFASYYLLPKGIETLKQQPVGFNKQMLKNIRKDITASDKFARHSISIFAAYCRFKELYGDSFKFFTQSYLGDFEYFPKPLPDAYITFSQQPGQHLEHYLVESFDGTKPHTIMRKRIAYLINYADSGEWSDTSSYPTLLFICKDTYLQRNVHQWAKRIAEETWAEKVAIRVTTLESLTNLRKPAG